MASLKETLIKETLVKEFSADKDVHGSIVRDARDGELTFQIPTVKWGSPSASPLRAIALSSTVSVNAWDAMPDAPYMRAIEKCLEVRASSVLCLARTLAAEDAAFQAAEAAKRAKRAGQKRGRADTFLSPATAHSEESAALNVGAAREDPLRRIDALSVARRMQCYTATATATAKTATASSSADGMRAGVGVYTTVRLPRGALLAWYRGRALTQDQLDKLYGADAAPFTLSIKLRDQTYFVDARLGVLANWVSCVNDASGTGLEPNVEMQDLGGLKTLRTIEPGEELLVRYSEDPEYYAHFGTPMPPKYARVGVVAGYCKGCSGAAPLGAAVMAATPTPKGLPKASTKSSPKSSPKASPKGSNPKRIDLNRSS